MIRPVVLISILPQDTACLALSTNETATRITHPAPDLSFQRFVTKLQASALRFWASDSLWIEIVDDFLIPPHPEHAIVILEKPCEHDLIAA